MPSKLDMNLGDWISKFFEVDWMLNFLGRFAPSVLYSVELKSLDPNLGDWGLCMFIIYYKGKKGLAEEKIPRQACWLEGSKVASCAWREQVRWVQLDVGWPDSQKRPRQCRRHSSPCCSVPPSPGCVRFEFGAGESPSCQRKLGRQRP